MTTSHKPQTIMGCKCFNVSSRTFDNGMQYDLYQGDSFGIIRLLDADANAIVSLVKFPTFEQAESKFNESIEKELAIEKSDKLSIDHNEETDLIGDNDGPPMNFGNQ